MPPAHIIKIEDARTGQWLRHLDPVTDPIRRIDMGWTMGDYNQLDVTVETVALRKSSSPFLRPDWTFVLLFWLACPPPSSVPSCWPMFPVTCLTFPLLPFLLRSAADTQTGSNGTTGYPSNTTASSESGQPPIGPIPPNTASSPG